MDDRCLGVPAHIRWRRHEQGGVVLNTRTAEVYKLNESAMCMWQLLAEGASPQEAVQAIAQETGAEPLLVQADMEQFLASMLEAGVLLSSNA